MAAAFHHGTETIRIDGGSSPVYTVNGAITAIIGTAPTGAVNELTVCQTKKDFARFGTNTGKGFTLPDAANIWTRYGSGVAYVVNVCDPNKHKSSVSDEVLSVDPDTLIAYTAHGALQAGEVLTNNGSPLKSGTHYTITDSVAGEIQFKTKPTAPKISYTYTDPSKVTEADIIGGYVASTGKRTGMELVTEGFNRFGADAKIIIAPEFDKTATCAAALITLADNLNAIAYINAPKGTTLSQAIQGRGSLGAINFNTSSDRAQLFFPHVVGLLGLESLATHAAGLRMKTDVEQGYWFSSSNRELQSVTGLEIGLTARADDPQSETNRLNEKGITTVFNSYGTGYRLWGNRLACFPTTSHIKNFEVVQRTGDIIDESIRRFELQYIDRPIDDALIDSLIEGIRTYLGTLKSIVGYGVNLDYDYDLTDAFSKGQVPLVYDYTPKLPAERITNTSVMTRKYLVNLISSN
ncbi:phage tail sheath subtilisin-like domain-containing protein [Kingella negevensis]|uniref:phage tail sheath family protein n=1 Tax=Kingella negevensis TaxID=1522312 RepID=UPI00254C7B20|nr:phage tail sheath subtilisin-like domain-containing protein [Kingella negevensis]MDK4685398.1 phage tail sheath subtilisin-like domain-containing protein [Kingella negevensis]MDK4708537.1 phage tail sheath subtilisin-like domain-containing protein [Kingella negevensis]MDK4710308.1 phage tail sheath subtilisin-like domain-containing protein [Kingella negevensis]